MKSDIQLFTKEDTKRFVSKSNKLIHFYAKKRFLNFLKCNKSNLDKCDIKIKSLRLNKMRKDFPDGFIKSPKMIAVYTVLYGNYDSIKPIKTKNKLCDYFIFTDQNVPNDSGWIRKDFVFPKKIDGNPVLMNRYLKMHPHLLFPDYEYSIYLDAVLCIELDILRLIGRMNNKLLGLFDHHRGTNCLYEEGAILKRIGKVPEKDIDKQLTKYDKEGFPHNFGFVECTLIVRRHNEQKCIDVMNTWWNEFISETKRDQLSFMYSLWKNGLNKSDIAYLGATYWDEPIFSSEAHK